MQSFIVAERSMSESGRVHVVEDRVEHHTQHHFLVDRQTDGNARVWKPALQQRHVATNTVPVFIAVCDSPVHEIGRSIDGIDYPRRLVSEEVLCSIGSRFFPDKTDKI